MRLSKKKKKKKRIFKMTSKVNVYDVNRGTLISKYAENL